MRRPRVNVCCYSILRTLTPRAIYRIVWPEERYPTSAGPLVLLAISNSRPVFEKSELSRVQESNQGNGDFVWMAARSTCDPS
jgi:hypothetical protein